MRYSTVVVPEQRIAPRFGAGTLSELTFAYSPATDFAFIYDGAPVEGYSDEFEDNWLLRIEEASHQVRGVESLAFTESLARLPAIASAVEPAIAEIEAYLGRSLRDGECQVVATVDEFPALFRCYVYLVGYGIGRIAELDAA